MSRLADLLEEAAGPIEATFAGRDLRRRAHRLRARRRVGRAVGATAALAAVIVAVTVIGKPGPKLSQVVTPGPTTTLPAAEPATHAPAADDQGPAPPGRVA